MDIIENSIRKFLSDQERIFWGFGPKPKEARAVTQVIEEIQKEDLKIQTISIEKEEEMYFLTQHGYIFDQNGNYVFTSKEKHDTLINDYQKKAETSLK